MNAATRYDLGQLPLPTLNDGTGRPAEWAAGIRPDGRWGIYSLNDGQRRTWAALVAGSAREAIAMSAALNERAAR